MIQRVILNEEYVRLQRITKSNECLNQIMKEEENV